MNEGNGVSTYIYSRLSQDSRVQTLIGKHPTLKIWQVYEVQAPQDAAHPFIVYIPQTPQMARGTGGKKIFRTCNYIIKAVGTGDSFSPVAEIANLIDEIMHKDQLLDDSEVVAGCSVVSDLQYSTVEDGVRYNHMGSIVEIMAYGKEG